MSDTQYSPGGAFIHYNPERVDYAITDGELKQLETCHDNLWKDCCLIGFSLGIPCAINAIVCSNKMATFTADLEFSVNALVGMVGISLGIVFSIAWKRTKKSAAGIISEIKGKPKIRLPDGRRTTR